MGFPQQQAPGQIQPQQQQGGGQYQVPIEKDPLATRGKLTSDYYNNVGLLRSFLQEHGADAAKPDYTQEGGGMAHQVFQQLQANVMMSANALKNEQAAENQMRPSIAEGRTRIKGGVDQSGMYATDAQNYTPTAIDPLVLEANKELGDPRYTQGDSNRLNQAVRDPKIQYYQQQIQKDPANAEYYNRQIEALLQNTPQVYAPAAFDRSGGSGNNSGIAAYVKKWSELANGAGFEPGENFDAQGNRIDTAKPSEFANRQLGFTKDGKKFVIDRFEKTVMPNGDFMVEAVDATGKNRAKVDPNNIVGSLRSFIETNEGATALKDLNTFFKSQGFDTATDSVPAGLYAPRLTDTSGQASTAPQVTKIRENIGNSLDSLEEGGFGRFLKTIALSNPITGLPLTAAGVRMKPAEIEYTIKDGRKLIVKKDGDTYKISNYRDIFGQPTKGVIKVNGTPVTVVGTFEKVPKATLEAMLEKFGVVNMMLKDSDGKEIAKSSGKTIKSSDIPSKAAAAGYSPEEYVQMLEERGVQIVE